MVTSVLETITLMEEISWRQKFRALWLKEGDKCMKYFHWVASSNRRNNSVEAVTINGSVFADRPPIKDHIVQYYDSLFS